MMLHLHAAVLLTSTLAAPALRAQCDPIVAPFAPSLQLTNADGSAGMVFASLTDTNGDLLVGGTFASAGGTPMSGLARWDGTTWSPIATLGGSSPTVKNLFLTRAGDLFVGGTFTSIDGVLVNGAARRDANGWHATPACDSLVEDSVGNVYVNGDGVSRWDGVAWTSLATPLVNNIALGILADGDLVAAGWWRGGVFPWTLVLMRWDGASWTELQPGTGVSTSFPNDEVFILRTLRNGDLLVGGNYMNGGGLYLWNSTGWHDVGGSFRGDFFNRIGVRGIAELPNGDLLVAGHVMLPGPVHAGLARFDGTSWHVIGGPGYYFSMSAFGDTSFALCDPGHPTLSLYQATCPAAAASLGVACPSSGGNNELTADGLPWVGSTFATRATGLPTNCVVAVVNGFSTFNHPLANLLPMAAPSCEHRETMDMLDLLVTNNGTATWSIAVPDVPALVGVVAYQQMFPLEVDSQLQILAASSTNTLRLQVGAF